MKTTDQSQNARHLALKQAFLRHAQRDGIQVTAIKGLRLHRHSHPVALDIALYQPSVCLLIQGSKRVTLGDQAHVYDTKRHLVASHHLPASGQVLTATAEQPFLCLELSISASDVAQMVIELGQPARAADAMPAQGMYTEETQPQLLDAMARLLQALDNQLDAHILGPAITREMVYRLLTTSNGWRLAHSAAGAGLNRRIGRVIALLRQRFREPLSISDLAQAAHMSESSLHQHFKVVTGATPLQYQKNLRLIEARRLLMNSTIDAATAGHTVGYSSPSQFSREYARLYGAPPRRDQTRLRAMLEPTYQKNHRN